MFCIFLSAFPLSSSSWKQLLCFLIVTSFYMEVLQVHLCRVLKFKIKPADLLLDFDVYSTQKGDDRGWDGWMTSPTQWTWVWAGSGRWWRTWNRGMLQSVGSQRVGHNWATEQEQHEIEKTSLGVLILPSACQCFGFLPPVPAALFTFSLMAWIG